MDVLFAAALLVVSVRSEPPVPLDNTNIETAVQDWCANATSATSTYGKIEDWDTSPITDMGALFKDCKNPLTSAVNLSNWNVARVTDMNRMFNNAEKFNSDLSRWDVSDVTNMELMFQSAESFRSDLSNWEVSAVKNMRALFESAEIFNSDLSKWSVGNVTNMKQLAKNAKNFNSDLSSWDISATTELGSMFLDAISFNITLCGFAWSVNSDVNDLIFENSAGSVGTGACDDIDPGSFCSGSGGVCEVVKTCPAGRFCPGGPSFKAAELCPAGKYSTTINATRLDECEGIECPAGSYCPSGTSSPTQYRCPAGKYGSSKGITAVSGCSMCPEAPAGRYASAVGITGNDECASADCPAGKYSATVGLTRIEDCEADCPAGKYSSAVGITSSKDCEDEDCPAGRYSATAGITSSEDCEGLCPAGKYSSASGITSSDACENKACPSGYWCDAGTSNDNKYSNSCPLGKRATGTTGNAFQQTACDLCPANTYGVANSSGSVDDGYSNTCEECLPGKSSASGAKQCYFLCDTGQYSDESIGSEGSSCVDCPVGRYSTTLGITTIGDCLECEAGFACSGGFRRVYCPAGTRSTETRDECAPCAANTYSLGGVAECSDCANGVSSAGASVCAPCKPGESQVGGTCVACPAGKARAYGERSCVDCAVGSTSKSNSSFCTRCAPGTKANAPSGGATVCEDCAAGYISKAGSVFCTACQAGTWQNGADCVACPAGYFGAQIGLFSETCDGICPPGTHSYRYATKCLQCEIGKHAPIAGLEDCVTCDSLLGLTSPEGATECVCGVGKYQDANEQCAPCAEDVECNTTGIDVATLPVKKGYWRSDSTTDIIFECPFQGACLGGADASCAEGNEGVLCAVCGAGFYRRNALSACQACGDSATAIATASLIIAAMVIALVLFLFINRRAPNGIIRPFILLVQLFTVMMAFDAPFPKRLVKAAKVLSAVNLGIELASPKCAGLSDTYYNTFGVMFIAMGGVSAATISSVIIHSFHEKLSWEEAKQSEVAKRCFRDLVVIVVLFHPPVSGKAMQFFRCREIGGDSYLMEDYSIKCFDDEWYTFLVVVLPVLILFSMGTPCYIAYVLYKQRDQLYDKDHKFVKQPLDILYAIYKKEAYWFESAQMFFKLALWGTLVFFGFKSVMQLATALVVNVLQLCVHIYFRPMGGEDAALLNTMQTSILVLVTFINFGGLVMNYLEVSKQLARGNDDLIAKYDRTMETLSIIMEILTLGIFVSFGSVGARQFYRFCSKLSNPFRRSSRSSRKSSMEYIENPSLVKNDSRSRGSKANNDVVVPSQGPTELASPRPRPGVIELGATSSHSSTSQQAEDTSIPPL